MEGHGIRKPKAGLNVWRRLLHEEPVHLRPAPEALRLPLLFSPRLRVACRMLGIAVMLHVIELLLTGHWLAAAAAASVAACAVPALRRLSRDHSPAQFLRLEPDGRLFLESQQGRVDEEVQLRPQSLRLGQHVLLVLSATDRSVRLLLGPDNLSPALLAALKCRLPGPAPPATALHSPAASSRSHPP